MQRAPVVLHGVVDRPGAGVPEGEDGAQVERGVEPPPGRCGLAGGDVEHDPRIAHTSPFETARLTLHIRAPIFVIRQWIRHRMSSRDGLNRWRIGRGAGRSACRAALRGPMPRFRGRSRSHSAARSPARAIPDAALPRSGELRLGSQQVREPEQQRETLAVLLKTPVADLRVPEVPLHVEKRMLSLRTHRGLPPLRLRLLAPPAPAAA